LGPTDKNVPKLYCQGKIAWTNTLAYFPARPLTIGQN
jgi:hypothetical protein